MPAEFLSLAEESGLIVPIGEWVIQEACREIGLLERQLNRPVDFSVNISPIQILHHDLPNLIARTLIQMGRRPSSLHIEITERNFLEDSHATHQTLDRIRNLGVQLVLDDFGVGFSTLSCITRFPLNWIKLDQSLVQNCTTDRGSLTVIRAILEMARGLDIRVVAEGVESLAQFALLAEEGCDAAQGFHFSHAVPAAKLPSLITSLEVTPGITKEWIST
jgi:EAL domain-containing protein (putative c-di-GMP-specific phosphodiesterase class I)